MEYMGAGSISDLMAICDRVLTEDQIGTVLKMSLHGLEYLHRMHKIHRDIKSGNILLNHLGMCKLGEFLYMCVYMYVYVYIYVCVCVFVLVNWVVCVCLCGLWECGL